MAKKPRTPKPAIASQHTMEFKEIPLGSIRVEAVRHPGNPETDWQPLWESIREIGLVEPLVVVPEGDHYYLVAGFRRLLALWQISVMDAMDALLRKLPDEMKYPGGGFELIRALMKAAPKVKAPCVIRSGVDGFWVTKARAAENIIRKPLTDAEEKRLALGRGHRGLADLEYLTNQYDPAYRASLRRQTPSGNEGSPSTFTVAYNAFNVAQHLLRHPEDRRTDE